LSLAVALVATAVLCPHPAAAAAPACAAPVHRGFDFMLGSWIARHADGEIIGTATISSVLRGCAVRFDWTGRKYSGTSYNAYIADERHWQKSWFDDTGNLELLTGHATPGVLAYEATTRDKTISPGPIVVSEEWRKLPDGRVRQLYRISTDARRSWKTLFTLYYSKVTS
jgi:hypothetical protein